MSSALLIVGGLAALTIGAELLVRGGTGLASWLGIRPMVIGLTVVSIGTSVPELAIGIDAAVGGNTGLAVGNIVGTNLVNILFILGLSALLVPVAFQRSTLKFDLPAMTAAAVVLYLLALDGTLSLADGLLLIAGGVVYTLALLRISRRDTAEVAVDKAGAAGLMQDSHRPSHDAVRLLVGTLVIVLGAELLVNGAVSTAESLGVSEAVIGLTVVAIGTSAPELVTTLLSTMRGDRDIAIGNLLGSSIYNIALVLGLTVIVAPNGVPVPDEVLSAALLLMVVVALASVPAFVFGGRIARAGGALFVATYLGCLAWLPPPRPWAGDRLGRLLSNLRPGAERTNDRGGRKTQRSLRFSLSNRLVRTASEAEAGQAARFRRGDYGRRAWLDAVHVPRRWSLRRCVEWGSDARPALIGRHRPAVVRQCLRDTRYCAPLGYPRRVTLDHDVRVVDRHRDRTPWVACNVASLPRTCARLEPERAVHPEGTDRSHMRAAVLVDCRQPRRVGVRRVRWRCRPRIELLDNGLPIHWGQPFSLTQIYDLHIQNLPAVLPGRA